MMMMMMTTMRKKIQIPPRRLAGALRPELEYST